MGSTAVMAVGALLGGYAVGALPVARLLVRRTTGMPPHPATARLPGVLQALLFGGVRTAFLALALELLKGAVVGVGARLYDPTPWFTATAIAGCVTGDAFPLGGRTGRRGLAPLLSGSLAALPGVWEVALLVAVPAALLMASRGPVLDGVVVVGVPAGFVAGTHDWRTLPPALLVVAVVLLRSGLRRRARREALERWRRLRAVGAPPTVVETPPPVA